MLSIRYQRLGLALTLAFAVILLVHYLQTGAHKSQSSFTYQDRFITVFNAAQLDDSNRIRAAAGDPTTHLLDLRNFTYTLQPRPLCEPNDDGAAELLGLLIVTSYAGHDTLRAAHRRAMPEALLRSLRLRRVFLLAALPATERFVEQRSLAAEAARFGDLLQGNFVEAYRRLSYKHTMGLRWAASDVAIGQCGGDDDGGGGGNSMFIVKADDDTVFDLYHLHAYLMELSDTADRGSDAFLAGFVLAGQRPIRNVANKWFVSDAEFPGPLYPDYLSGWLYVTTPPTARRLVAQAQRIGAAAAGILWIDDLWITGVLRDRLAIRLRSLNRWFSANAEFLECCIADRRRWAVRCDYQVGPNGGDSQAIVRFAEAMRGCYVQEDGDGDGEQEGAKTGCTERGPGQSLAQTCVAQRSHLAEDHGRPVVEAVRL